MLALRGARDQRWLLIFAAIIIVGLGIRLMFLGDRALWLDEAYSVWFSDRTWHYLWREVPQFETHPPLYYSLLKLWRSLGSDEFTLRLLSALVSLATVPMVALASYIAAPSRHKLPLAATAGFLFAVSSVQQEYAQQARPYAFLVFGMSLTLTSALWILVHPERSRRSLFRLADWDRTAVLAYAGLGTGMAMLMWMHNLGVVFTGVIGVVLIAWWISQAGHRLPLFANLSSAAILALALYAVNIPTLLLQTQSVSENFWLEAPSFTQTLQVALQLYGQWQLAVGTHLVQYMIQLMIGIPLAVLGLAATWRFCAQSRDLRWVFCLLLATAVGPVLLMLALTFTVQPVFMLRTLIPVQVPWMVICAAAPFAVPPKRSPTVWRMLLAIGLISIASFSFQNATQERRDQQRPWRKVAEQIANSSASDAPVIILPNSVGNAIEYYDIQLDLNLDAHALPGRYPVRGPGYHYPAGGAGEPGMDDRALAALAEVTRNTDTVWLVTRFESLFDPEQLVRRSLSREFSCSTGSGPGFITVTRFDRFTNGSRSETCE